MNPKQQFKAVIQSNPGGGAYVNVPFDVEKAFGRKRVKILAMFDGELFSTLSFTHQREYIEWIEDAKKAETRERRKARMIEMLNKRKRAR
ncbi:MAG TPA: YdeI/OmpD-associated family protein [Rhodothermales bacterium]